MANVARRKGVGRLLIILNDLCCFENVRAFTIFNSFGREAGGGGGGEGLKLECVYRRRGERRGEGGRRR